MIIAKEQTACKVLLVRYNPSLVWSPSWTDWLLWDDSAFTASFCLFTTFTELWLILWVTWRVINMEQELLNLPVYLIMGLVLVIFTVLTSIIFGLFCVIVSLFFYVDFIYDVMVSSLIPNPISFAYRSMSTAKKKNISRSLMQMVELVCGY